MLKQIALLCRFNKSINSNTGAVFWNPCKDVMPKGCQGSGSSGEVSIRCYGVQVQPGFTHYSLLNQGILFPWLRFMSLLQRLLVILFTLTHSCYIQTWKRLSHYASYYYHILVNLPSKDRVDVGLSAFYLLSIRIPISIINQCTNHDVVKNFSLVGLGHN